MFLKPYLYTPQISTEGWKTVKNVINKFGITIVPKSLVRWKSSMIHLKKTCKSFFKMLVLLPILTNLVYCGMLFT